MFDVDEYISDDGYYFFFKEYAKGVFGFDINEADLLVSAHWDAHDNTPRGAAKRLIYMALGNPLPSPQGELTDFIATYSKLTKEDFPLEEE